MLQLNNGFKIDAAVHFCSRNNNRNRNSDSSANAERGTGAGMRLRYSQLRTCLADNTAAAVVGG